MNAAEFLDTNVLLYAFERDAGRKMDVAQALLKRLLDEGTGALSTQVLSEFYSVGTRKLKFSAEEAERLVDDFADWRIHCPAHADLLRASRLHRHHQISWWDALIVNSAIQLGCATLWTEDLADGRQFGPVTVRNPFTA